MPVLLSVLSDPFDLVVEGEQLRDAAFVSVVGNTYPLIADDGPVDLPLSPGVVIAGAISFPPMLTQAPSVRPTRSVEAGTLMGNNAVIATPCGALVDLQRGRLCMMSDFVQGTNTFTLTGVTRNSAGVALASCEVRVFKTGDDVLVAQTISDGSGNYSVTLPTNLRHYVVSYKTGSPDVTGATVNTLTAV